MTISLIMLFCVLILLSYVFDLTSKFTKVPTVIFLLFLGWLVKQLSTYFAIDLPKLEPLLPILGTVGLILIVLEGSLELELNSSKKSILTKTSLSAFIPMLILIFILGYLFSYYSGKGLVIGITNAIPLCVISSAIAIPSVQNLSTENKEFTIYESSVSDILGVLIFNFFIAKDFVSYLGMLSFLMQIIAIIVISLVSCMGLAFLIKKIDHHVKFIPIMVMTILIYDVAKQYHLPALFFILMFGLFLNNLDELKHFSFIKKLQPKKLDIEVKSFRGMVIEMAFLVRTLFFILFGFLIDTSKLLDATVFMIALGIVALVILVRFIYFKIAKIPIDALLFVAPRGLITILLFISIPASTKIPFVNESLILLIIILSAFVMMFGLFQKKAKITTSENL
jgi:cell volume regulation protein A